MNNIIIKKPKVVIWFKIYAGFLSFIYLITLIISPFLLVSNDEELVFTGILLLILSIPFIVICALPIFLPRKPWVWIYSLIIIGLGMTGCCLPACIPILIFWIKPEVKRYYGYKENVLTQL